MPLTVIGFAGKKMVGKGEAARALENLGFFHYNFADPLKEAVMDLFEFTHEELYDPKLKEIVVERWPHKSPREVLQKFGTEVARHCANGVWVRKWLKAVRNRQLVVCSDVRFEDEAEAVRSIGGRVVLINGRTNSSSNEAYAGHVSEADLPGRLISTVIRNDGSVEQLHERVLQYVRSL